MKRNLSFIAALMVAMISVAQTIDVSKLSEYDSNAPIGFGANVTGGEGGDAVTVTTYAELKAQLGAFNTTKKIIYVKGTINFDGQYELRGVKNKTIIGLEGTVFENLNEDVATSASDKDAAVKKTGILLFRECDNIAIRNITFKSAGACDFNANDNLYLQGSTNIWVDHCDFQDGVDGNLDICLASNNISVTWCRFRYFKDPRPHGYGGSSDDHRFTNLIGNGDGQTGDQDKLNTTFVNCWWDNGCKERMPRVRFGKVHTLNCLYSSSNTNYCVGGGYKSNVYIEKCAFTSNKAKNTPWKCYATSSGKTDYNVTITGCQNAADKQDRSGSIDYFIPTSLYTYASYDASLVESVVSNADNGAGPTIKFTSTGINTITANSTDLNPNMPRYNSKGQRVDSSYKGLVIQGGKKYIQK